MRLFALAISSLIFASTPVEAPFVSFAAPSSSCVPQHADDDSCLTADEWESTQNEQSRLLKEMDDYRSEVERLCYGVMTNTIYPVLAPEPGQVNTTSLQLYYEPEGAYFLDQEVRNRCTLQ